MLADDGLPGEDLAMKLGLALRRRLARFEGLPDEGAGVARTALQAGYGVAEAGTVPGRLKAKPGGELQVHGSGTLIRWLLDNDLVDEITLLIVPVVLGQGTRLFPDTGPDMALDLVGSRADSKDVMIQVYRRTGPARPASPRSLSLKSDSYRSRSRVCTQIASNSATASGGRARAAPAMFSRR
jgi:hypothetical protein